MNKKPNYFLRILFIFIIIFVALSIALESGYYDVKIGRKASLTEEALKNFEEDVSSGKEIDIKDYIIDETQDYSSNVSKIGTSIGSKIDRFMNYGINDFLNILGQLF